MKVFLKLLAIMLLVCFSAWLMACAAQLTIINPFASVAGRVMLAYMFSIALVVGLGSWIWNK